MTPPKTTRWPKGGREARDLAVMEATCAQRELFSIFTTAMSHEDEYKCIGRAIQMLGRVVRQLESVQADADNGGSNGTL